MLRNLLRALPALFLLSALVLASSDDEIVREFKKYFKKFTDTPSRIEAVRSLEGAETPKVVSVLVPVLSDKEPEVVGAAVHVLGTFKTDAPIARLFEALAENKKEEQRVGMLMAIALGAYKGPSEPLMECLEDRSWDVRRRAVQALAARKEVLAVPIFVELCKDKEPAVRCAALEGLADLRRAEVVDRAIAALQDKVWQVRASAIAALGVVRAQRAIEPLITRMEKEEGRLRQDIGYSLGEITGKGYGQDAVGWRSFWERVKERYKIPTEAEMVELREKQAEMRAKYHPKGAVSYHGIETPSRSILFIIDVSGSMENMVVERERFADGEYPSYSRIDIVKTELARTIEGLEPYVKFNVLAFATKVKQWKKKLVPANVLNKRSAMDWSLRLEAIGGNSKEGLAAVGLTGTANLAAGKTNTHGVLMRALSAAGRGAKDKHYDVEVDTIFFLSDGRPTHGKLVDPDDILKEIREANDLRKVVIHTIAIGEFQKNFMKRLAAENAGVFVDLGR